MLSSVYQKFLELLPSVYQKLLERLSSVYQKLLEKLRSLSVYRKHLVKNPFYSEILLFLVTVSNTFKNEVISVAETQFMKLL